MTTLIIDNGAGNLKVGFLQQDQPTIIPNCTAKVKKSMQYLVAEQIYQCQNTSLLDITRAFDRGYLTNCQNEIEVWSHVFQDTHKCNPADTSLLLTEPLLNPYTIQNDMNELVFEYFGFKEYLRRPAAWFSANNCTNYQHLDSEKLPACMIIDSGFSFTHAVPFVNGKCRRHAIKRINIGGKLLTNYLKELVSYRQWNMMDEFLLMSDVKEKLCYVSNNMLAELKAGKGRSRMYNSIHMSDMYGEKLKKNYVLPDFLHIMKGYIKGDNDPITKEEQILTMETERFAVPELLFNPCDIGLNQAGIAEATWQSLSDIQNEIDIFMATSKILLTGGSTKFPNFKERYEQDLRPLVPDMYRMNIFQPDNPETYAWESAKAFCSNYYTGNPYDQFIKRSAFLEYGNDYCNEKFDSGW